MTLAVAVVQSGKCLCRPAIKSPHREVGGRTLVSVVYCDQLFCRKIVALCKKGRVDAPAGLYHITWWGVGVMVGGMLFSPVTAVSSRVSNALWMDLQYLVTVCAHTLTYKQHTLNRLELEMKSLNGKTDKRMRLKLLLRELL